MVGSETMTVETEENETECESDLQRHEEWSGLESGREELRRRRIHHGSHKVRVRVRKLSGQEKEGQIHLYICQKQRQFSYKPMLT